MTEQERRQIPEAENGAAEPLRRAQLFEAANAAYRGAGAKREPDLDAWDNALADGLSS